MKVFAKEMMQQAIDKGIETAQEAYNVYSDATREFVNTNLREETTDSPEFQDFDTTVTTLHLELESAGLVVHGDGYTEMVKCTPAEALVKLEALDIKGL